MIFPDALWEKRQEVGSNAIPPSQISVGMIPKFGEKNLTEFGPVERFRPTLMVRENVSEQVIFSFLGSSTFLMETKIDDFR